MQVTPELLAWLESQRQAGFGDEALLKALLQAGYPADFAQRLLAGSSLAQSQSPATLLTAGVGLVSATVSAGGSTGGRSGQTNDADTGNTHRDTSTRTDSGNESGAGSLLSPGTVAASTAGFFETVDPLQFSNPVLFNTDNIRRAHDVDVRILMQLAMPRVAVFEGLLSEAECDELVGLARPRLSSSLTVDRDSGNSVQHAARVSSGMFFHRGEIPLVALLEKRISALLGFPEVNGEGLQILNYKPGGKYDPHQDYFDPAEPGSAVHLKRGGQRIATLILYLNTPEAGGGTVFPDIGLTVSAARGRAVFFSYPVAHPSSKCLHGGNPVIRGEKWIATKWIRQSAFV